MEKSEKWTSPFKAGRREELRGDPLCLGKRKRKIALKMHENVSNFKNFPPAAPVGTAGNNLFQFLWRWTQNLSFFAPAAQNFCHQNFLPTALVLLVWRAQIIALSVRRAKRAEESILYPHFFVGRVSLPMYEHYPKGTELCALLLCGEQCPRQKTETDF